MRIFRWLELTSGLAAGVCGGGEWYFLMAPLGMLLAAGMRSPQRLQTAVWSSRQSACHRPALQRWAARVSVPREGSVDSVGLRRPGQEPSLLAQQSRQLLPQPLLALGPGQSRASSQCGLHSRVRLLAHGRARSHCSTLHTTLQPAQWLPGRFS